MELASGIDLQSNFISRSHYLMLELLGIAGILHQLVLFLAFPDLDVEEYSLRNTGNRSIGALHSMLRGGTANLPIISANLTFQDFLSRLNKVNQIKKLNILCKKLKEIQFVAQRSARSQMQNLQVKTASIMECMRSLHLMTKTWRILVKRVIQIRRNC